LDLDFAEKSNFHLFKQPFITQFIPLIRIIINKPLNFKLIYKMKKHLLLGIGLGIGLCAAAQNSPNKQLLKPSIANKMCPLTEYTALTGDEKISSVINSNRGNHISPAKPKSVGVNIGVTIYDLQTNASVARRIINHGNGTISVAWVNSTDNSPYTTRGTGYNYFDGTSWLPLAAVANRLEASVRTGWPGLGTLGTGKEFVLAHDATAYLYQQGTNTAIGSNTTWTFATSQASPHIAPANHGTIWNRVAIAGPGDTTIHVISNVYTLDTTVRFQGVKAPMLYARSTDGGKTWPVSNMPLPGNDSTRTTTGNGDVYSIDAQGNTVVIVRGGLAEDVAMWKSTDNGTTFKKTLVDSIPFVKNMTGASATDTMMTNDGSLSVVLDNNNKAHVAYAGSRTILNAGAVNFFPGTIDLVYWNEIKKTKVHIPINTADVDVDGDGLFSVADSTTSSTKCRYGAGSVLNKPSVAVDASGNVFIVFSLPADADSTTDGSNQSFRDIWVVASQDGGTTWGHLQNLTQTVQEEEAFANVAKLVDGYLHIAYMHDLEPGTALTNTDPDGPNDIRYLKVSTADVLAGVAGIKTLSTKNDLISIGQNYPNPFSNTTMVDVTVKKTDDLNIEISNILGQVVSIQTYKAVAPGTHTFTLDGTSLSPGIYTYTIRTNDASVTRKMSVK
jgi:hypothetical protein